MTSRARAIANDPAVQEAAADFLSAGGSAVGAVVCGFFAAAGAYSGVLLGPVSILVAGVGSGARAFDGRLRQPGQGSKRPRGFTDGQDIPEQARVAVPAAVPASLVALAYDGGQSLGKVLKPGITRAQRAGADARASLLRLVRTAGSGAFADNTFVRPMLRVAGPSQGGLLSSVDFGHVSGIDHEASIEDGLVEAPWAGQGADADKSSMGVGCAVCAVDVRGTFAALCYRRLVDGFPIDDLELEAPLSAVPVLRGVTRVAPGTPLAAPAPVAMRADESGQVVEVLAAPNQASLDRASLDGAPLRLRRSPTTKAVEQLPA